MFSALCFSSSVIFLLVDACVGLNWLLVSFLSHVNKNIIHSFIHLFISKYCFVLIDLMNFYYNRKQLTCIIPRPKYLLPTNNVSSVPPMVDE